MTVQFTNLVKIVKVYSITSNWCSYVCNL